jgi:hypothetical protein
MLGTELLEDSKRVLGNFKPYLYLINFAIQLDNDEKIKYASIVFDCSTDSSQIRRAIIELQFTMFPPKITQHETNATCLGQTLKTQNGPLLPWYV